VKPETIKLDEVEYVRKGSLKQSPETTGEIRIVILQRGWVLVGYFSQDAEKCKLEKASVIRQWGTSKGLGEIAVSGPTSKTILDPAPTVHFHELTIIATIECVRSAWSSKLT
jgi:hypothetical protein